MPSLRRIVQANFVALSDGLTQTELVRRGLSAGTAHRLTTGQNVTLDALETAAKALRVPVSALLNDPRAVPATRGMIVTEGDLAEATQHLKDALAAVTRFRSGPRA